MKHRTIGVLYLVLMGLSLLFVSAGVQDAGDTDLRRVQQHFSARSWLSTGSIQLAEIRAGLSHLGPRTFNPAFAVDPESKLVAGLLSIDLLTAAETISWGAIEPAGTRLTITLRSGLSWADGSALTASDWVDAVNEIYTDSRVDSVYAKPLARLGELRWSAPNPLTVQIESAKALTEAALLAACFIAPQPMARLREWRKLGQPGSLGTGLRAKADDQYFGLINTVAEDIAACGRWQVAHYRPGNSLDLTLRDSANKGDNMKRIRFQFYRDPLAMGEAFAAGSLDILPLLGKTPNPQPRSASPKIVAFAASPLVVSLIVNPDIVQRFPWIMPILGNGLDRQGWCRGFLQGLSVPELVIWHGKYPMASAIDSPVSATDRIQLAVQYDKAQPRRAELAGMLETHGIENIPHLSFRAVPSSVDDMAAWLAFGGEWDAMLVSINEAVDPTALLKYLGSRLVPIVALYRPLSLLWSHQDMGRLAPEVENLFLAYASALH